MDVLILHDVTIMVGHNEMSFGVIFLDTVYSSKIDIGLTQANTHM